MRQELSGIYKKLYAYFGPQRWWPADTRFEVMVGAILTQNTNWLNVEKAINNLKKQGLLAPRKLYKLTPARLSKFIVPCGYYNIKAKRLKEFLHFFFKSYKGGLKKMLLKDLGILRQQLLCVKGIGPETADSILLYALDKPIFVIDAYTKRIFSRHHLVQDNASYEETQDLFMKNLKKDARLFNEYHALLVKLGKEFCLKNKPRCEVCPLKEKSK